MPRKANTNKPTIFEIVGGNAPVSNYQINPVQNSPVLNAGFVPPPIDPVSSLVLTLNSNPYIIGLAYLFLNVSGRFLSLELTKQQEAFLSHPFLRPFILFAVMFVSTRNVAIAFWSTLAILAVIWFFANENHALCLIPGWRKSDDNKNKEHDKLYENNMKTLQKKDESGHHDETVKHHMEQAVHNSEDTHDSQPDQNT